MPIGERPVNPSECRVRDRLAIQPSDLSARRIECITRCENVNQARQGISCNPRRELVGGSLDQTREQWLVRIPAVERDEQVGAIAHDGTAEAGSPLHRRELALASRTRLKIGLGREIAIAVIGEGRAAPFIRSGLCRGAYRATPLPALRDVVHGAGDLELANRLHRKREGAGAKLAGAQHVARLHAVDTDVGRCPALAEER